MPIAVGNAKLSPAMMPERKAFLNSKLREAAAKQPELKRLKALLLRLGGDLLVAPSKPDQDVPMLLEQGFVMSGPIKLKVMKSKSCHQNVALVWSKRKFGIVGIATGYALTNDGL